MAYEQLDLITLLEESREPEVDLQKEYIDHFISKQSTMSIEHAILFLQKLEIDVDAPYRERRMIQLNLYIDDYHKRAAAQTAQEKKNLEDAIACRDLTNEWLEKGATHRNLGVTMVVWEYEGEQFYNFTSGILTAEALKERRIADKRLTAMIEERKGSKA